MQIARLWIASVASVCQAVVPNNCAVFKNWSDDGGIPNSNSVSRKTSTLKPFEVTQTNINSRSSSTNCVLQLPASRLYRNFHGSLSHVT